MDCINIQQTSRMLSGKMDVDMQNNILRQGKTLGEKSIVNVLLGGRKSTDELFQDVPPKTLEQQSYMFHQSDMVQKDTAMLGIGCRSPATASGVSYRVIGSNTNEASFSANEQRGKASNFEQRHNMPIYRAIPSTSRSAFYVGNDDDSDEENWCESTMDLQNRQFGDLKRCQQAFGNLNMMTDDDEELAIPVDFSDEEEDEEEEYEEELDDFGISKKPSLETIMEVDENEDY